jgi:UDP-4-amino-4-deoxy-L-arabinose formyltransferase/UDP-glucuronic acid dehydrogenase (UDP-4-keto-hexauronic acid decarboxylating)
MSETGARFILAGDTDGIVKLLTYVPRQNVVGLCAASVRPQYLDEIENLGQELNIPRVVQPRPNDQLFAQFLLEVQSLRADLFLVNSYSMLMTQQLLKSARRGGVNLHGALLPRNRGPNPTQWAMIRGETETGITMHEMSDGLDQGAIIDQSKVPIYFDDTWLVIAERLSNATNVILKKTVPSLLDGGWTSRAQDENLSTQNVRRTPEDSQFDWTDPLIDIYRLHRAVLPPHPPAFALDSEGRSTELGEPLTITGLLERVVSHRTAWGKASSGLVWTEESAGGEGESALLRPIAPKDSEFLRELALNGGSRGVDREFWPSSEADTSEWIRCHRGFGDKAIVFAAENAQGVTTGLFALRNIDWEDQSAEFVLGLSRLSGMSDVATQSIQQRLCDFGFFDLRLQTISVPGPRK